MKHFEREMNQLHKEIHDTKIKRIELQAERNTAEITQEEAARHLTAREYRRAS